MSIKSNSELEALRRVGRIVRLALDEMTNAVRPGITTDYLSNIGDNVLLKHGAHSAPRKVYRFPGAVCISLNDEAVHGVPSSSRVLQSGDLLKLDLVAEKDGFFADAAVTVKVGSVSSQAAALARCAEEAFSQATKVARSGNRIYDIGRAIERHVRQSGFNVMKALGGHGVGRTIHEEPSVPNYFDRTCRGKLKEGLVLAIEPIICAGSGQEKHENDGWTISTADGTLSAHYEHTVVITTGEPILVTVA
jgi:methionyl aminopeptidase